ncbi:MAG TPA: SIS domain-containing protein, partial [Aminobacteriaceae bacterium]|nr:SIS domain-containing protein [Aminobacteriaceae bacterium]
LKRPLPDDAKRMLTLLWGDEGRTIGEALQGALPAISLGSHGALMTAFANDADGRFAFAQQAMGYARPGDVALGISTSGNAENVRFALMAAKSRGASTVALTGADGGLLAKYADCCIRVPDRRTFRVQEHHLRIYHFLCAFVESELFDE